MSPWEAALAVAELVHERDALKRRVEILDAKLIEVTDPDRHALLVRETYRRGYLAGRAAQRRGAPQVTNPEHSARGWVRQALTDAT